MTKSRVFAVLPLILFLITPVAARPQHKQANSLPATGMVGREVEAPPWSAACMSDHGPTQCNEPMWVYGSSAEVSRHRGAF
jgi:hypothetical protein